MPGNYKIIQFYDAKKCVPLARIYTESWDHWIIWSQNTTNSNILEGERWSYDCIITAVITAACDAFLNRNSLNQIKRDVIWLRVPQRIMTAWTVPLLQLNKCLATNTGNKYSRNQYPDRSALKKPQKEKRNHIGPQGYNYVCRASFKRTSHSYGVLFTALAATVKYLISCCNISWWDMKSTVNCDSDVFSSSKRRKLAASTDLGHLQTHGENIWN